MGNSRRFAQVDVFTATGLLGNPVAVVLDREGLDTSQMQRFTDWTNLSEATFIGPPSDPAADYSVRIFCPGRELPFAGHPTLGSAHAWLRAGGQPRGEVIVQECGVGLVPIRHEASTGTLAFQAPPRRRSGPLDPVDLQNLVRGLNLPPEAVLAHSWCDNGPGWQGLLLDSAERVLRVVPDAAVLAGLDVGIVGAHSPGGDADVEVRAFFPGNNGLTEDPVTGSLNAALAQWLIADGVLPPTYVAAQGTVLGRAGRVHVEQAEDGIWIGGRCVTVIDGEVVL
jgi:PhzF family phenazine biosynthesis protein